MPLMKAMNKCLYIILVVYAAYVAARLDCISKVVLNCRAFTPHGMKIASIWLTVLMLLFGITVVFDADIKCMK